MTVSTAQPELFRTLPPSPLRGRRRCNLLLVANRRVNHDPEFERLARLVREIDPKVSANMIYDGPYPRRRHLWRWRPTLVFSPVGLEHFHPVRGRIVSGNSMSKSDEIRALETAGVPVPRWTLATEANPRPGLSDFSPYVVVKPDTGGRGAEVKIVRKGRAKWKPGTTSVGGDFSGLMVQDFIYTGPWPTSYRVTTLFGQVLWSLKVEASRERPPLPSPDGFDKVEGNRGVTIVSNSRGCVMSLNYDEEVIRFGESVHRAFPGIPLLGIDIVREEGTGKMYVLEVNSSGFVWHFSSPLGVRAQQEFGFRFEDQFDGIRKAAHVLAAKAQELAE